MPLSELEGVILGIVSTREPCSAYVVRQRFERSPTWGWSSSKGSIYPAIARLKSRSLLAGEPAQGDRRNTELLRITASGRQALQEWIGAVGMEMGGVPVDPIRTRVNYLAALPLSERRAFLDRCEHAAFEALARASTAVPDPQARNRWTLHATALGILMQVETKLRWLRAIRAVALEEDRTILPETQP